MDIRNKIGLEAEFFLRDRKNELVYPQDFGFEADEFLILGEFRASAGFTRHETIGNFIAALLQVTDKAKSKGLTVDFSGMVEITPEKKAEIIRKVGAKYVPPCQNVYKTDILGFSDDVVGENGRITVSRLSAGLHVHFSRRVYHTYFNEEKRTVTSDMNLLTDSQIKRIVRTMDKEILPPYAAEVPLKYRQPGFYEKKPWGFEYRSLPMVVSFTDSYILQGIVDFAFSQLEKLER